MATIRPSSQNLSARPASQLKGDLKRNGVINKSGEKEEKCSTSSCQSQNHDLPSLPSHGLQSQRSQNRKSQSPESQRHESSCQKNAGCLEILTSEGQSSFQEFFKPNDRLTSGNRSKKAPSINRIHSAPRTPTPTKQIILEAAKRKQELMLAFEDTRETNIGIQQNPATKENKKESGQRSPKADLLLGRTKEDKKKNKDEEDDDDEEEEEEEESSTEEELVKAPNELMMEFLDCVLKGDYANGLKLCTMILLYEPENAEALSFKLLIEEKIAVDASNEGDSDDDDDDDDEDDEEDSSEGETDTSNTSSEDDDDEQEEEEEEEETKSKGQTKEKAIFVP